MKILLIIAYGLLFISGSLHSNDKTDTEKIYGVTIDDISRIDDIIESLKNLSKKATVRIVFDEWIPAAYYKEAVSKIHDVSFIMGEVLDSYYFKNYSVIQYNKRLKEYINALGSKVDIWEIANEINGEWLGNNKMVVKKMTNAFRIVKDEGKIAAVTLYYNSACFEKPENEMFKWVQLNIPQNMKDSIDYIFVSYYEDDCNNLQPDWQTVFDSLHVLFPNSKLGIGECGTVIPEKKKIYIERYYSMEIKTPNYVGGYFWWYYKQDCVPYTQNLWEVMNSCIRKDE